MNMRETAKVLGAVVAAASFAASATTVHADIKCRQTLAKESSKLTQAIAKTLQKCEQAVHDGKLTGPCSADAKTIDAITKAKGKFKDKLLGTCATSTGEFAFGRCPNETGATLPVCGGILIQSKDNEAGCLSCLADHNAQELVSRVLYGSLHAPANKDIGKCQKTVGQETLKFYLAASNVLAKCQDQLLKKKLPSCPDPKTTEALDKAESNKVAKITKACCGDDGICGGATCQTGQPSAIGDPCEANQDCGRCIGSTTPDKPCTGNGQCQSSPGQCNSPSGTCAGGPNVGNSCNANANCPMSTCTRPAGTCVGGTNDGNACNVTEDCPSIPGGTCGAGTCGGVDDFRPTDDIGLPVPCPGLTAGGSSIIQTGQTGLSLLACVDTQASDRALCQDAAGATFGHDSSLPANCADATAECTTSGTTKTATIAIVTPASLGGISISLGYQHALLPGSGDDSTARVVNVQTGAAPAVSDTNDAVITSIVDLSGLNAGNLYTVQFDTCMSQAAPTTADFGCVVRSASDLTGVEVLDGVTCSVVSVL